MSVVSWATTGTVLGWVLRDYWVTQEEAEHEKHAAAAALEGDNEFGPPGDSLGIVMDGDTQSLPPLSRMPSQITMSGTTSAIHSRNPSYGSGMDQQGRKSSSTSPREGFTELTPSSTSHATGGSRFATHSNYHPYEGRTSRFSPRNQERLATAKSALLIYCALLGLSPILKSLTKSTSPDSIWAVSSWLIIINVFTFDYGAGVEAKFVKSGCEWHTSS